MVLKLNTGPRGLARRDTIRASEPSVLAVILLKNPCIDFARWLPEKTGINIQVVNRHPGRILVTELRRLGINFNNIV
jgi:hypothetical protein